MPSLEITTVIGCTLMCTYCPQLELRSAYGRDASKKMALADFEYFLGKVPKHVRIDFSGMAEPWLNDSATLMLEHALRQGYKVAVYTTLEGMDERNAAQVLALLQEYGTQVEELCLHLPDAQGNMRGWRVSEVYRRVLATFLSEGKDLPIKHFTVMTMDKGGDFHPDIRNLLGTRARPFQGHSRAGSLSDREIEPPPTPRHDAAVSCKSTPYYDRNVVLPNGDVVLCCMDYNLKHIIGNLHRDDYYALFRSEVLRDLIVLNQKPEFSKCSLCKSCDNVLFEDQYLEAGKTRRSLQTRLKSRARRILS